jgi:hypothetical protein
MKPTQKVEKVRVKFKSDLPSINKILPTKGMKVNKEKHNDSFINKSESLNFETINEKSLKSLGLQLEENLKEKLRIISSLNELNSEIREINLDIDVLENYEKYYDLSEKLRKIIENELNTSSDKKKGIKKKDTNVLFDSKVFEIRNSLQVIFY